MPRWRALSDELDPQVREFAEQLRRIVERSGMGIGAVADRTGYSKTSWERYLNGRLLPPRGATEALAEATGADAGHLCTIWELAERAWSRSELRHDVTMEGVRVAEARAALAEYAPPAPQGKRGRARRKAVATASGAGGGGGGVGGGDEVDAGDAGDARGTGNAREVGGAGEVGGVGRTAQPPESHEPRKPAEPRQFQEHLPSARAAGVDARAQAIPLAGGARPRPRRRAALLFTVGAVGALLVVVAAVLLLGDGTGGARKPAPLAAVTDTGSPAARPAGVKCAGSDCTGKDPETMGCGGQRATTAGSATVGTTYLEVRYSATCKAAWARMTQGGPGDTLRVSAASRTGRGRIEHGTDGHSTMVAAAAPGEARACAVLSSGRQGCTVPRRPAASGASGRSGASGVQGTPGATGAAEAPQEAP
ncbi:XRE family transcriptional regulator [Streptomyces sp. I05A-00742]|uniref:helix-turn-helix domain-containing protein n=1 Tax=Streptomyces sp. I05A-00742 TaxID=2732853 RepID=UPI001489787C|nr:XRE family transcriptional regulator [Streptomyces sp. I05A-00742]